MKNILKLESLGLFILCLYLFKQQGFAWWSFWCCLLLPDLSMLGYLFNSKFGGYLYNFFHHQLLGIFLLLVGSIFLIKPLLFWGIIFLAHSNMDRIFGYGLKYTNSFKNTHLGPIHNSNKKQQK